MFLGYFTEEAYDKLKQNISANAEKYAGEDNWLEDFFAGEEYFGISKSVQVNAFKPSYQPGPKDDAKKSEEDLVNARMIYDAFKSLTPLQASNKYMWTYLCHAIPEYREYIQDRWMGSGRENTIKTRFFVEGGRSSLVNDNALSRLWWYAHLTYDHGSKNPYALTSVLLTNQTICTDIIDTLNSMNFTRIKGVLLAVRDFCELNDGNEGVSGYLRECNKYLNHYAAVTNMEFLEADEIRDLAYDYMVKLKEEKEGARKKKEPKKKKGKK